MVLGCLVHLAGDAITVQGIPLLWPLRPKPAVETAFWKKNGHFALPIIGNAGSKREGLLVVAVDLYIVWVVVSDSMQGAQQVLASL